jgi:hypothetical protein
MVITAQGFMAHHWVATHPKNVPRHAEVLGVVDVISVRGAR